MHFFDANFEHPTLQGVTFAFISTQGAASLALGYEEHWAFSPLLLNPKVEILSLLVKCTMHKKKPLFCAYKNDYAQENTISCA